MVFEVVMQLLLREHSYMNSDVFWVFLTSEVMEAVGGQKHPSEAKKGMKELIY